MTSDHPHSPTVIASASTLITACGAGCQPCSTNPCSPTVRDIAKAPSEPSAATNATARNHAGPPSAIRIANATKTLVSTRNPGPMAGMYEYPCR
ncbi:hypothetical protein BST42_08930 [Mycolicibacterium rhodesiae]|uniref:Uncharacterized protein n=1 Tax=Mycolicibacterium rhodesiae TaxID=36814 RepID=A0A1X0J010_MYCRH|nr:hypothetical protein BST42_08930 [Mycolicibacterium rhodesiae]